MGSVRRKKREEQESTARLDAGEEEVPASNSAFGREADGGHLASLSARTVVGDRGSGAPSSRRLRAGRLARVPARRIAWLGAAVVASAAVLALVLALESESLEELTLSRITVTVVERSTLQSVPVGSRCVVQVTPRIRHRRGVTLRGSCALQLTCDGKSLRALGKELECGWSRRGVMPSGDPSREPVLVLRDEGLIGSGVRWSYDAGRRAFSLQAHGGSASLRETVEPMR